MPDNQNGTFPFNRDSTAFALDYLGAFLRGCHEGWVTLARRPRAAHYGPGDLGAASGSGTPARGGAGRREVRSTACGDHARPTWLDPDWADRELPCSRERGCPTARPEAEPARGRRGVADRATHAAR